jgi:exonuclease SbcC
MLPKRLEIRNFLAYRQPDPIYFEGVHLACLSGPNGAGKSTLLDAITWALWGKARASDDELIHQGQSEMLVQLDFVQGHDLYRVVRKRQKGKSGGRSTLDLFIKDPDTGQWSPISAPAVRETNKRIAELLRLEYNTFVHSAFLQQGRADLFTVAQPHERKQLLADILGLEQWAVYEEQAKERLRLIKHNIDLFSREIEEITRQEAEEPALQRDLALAEQTLADAQQRSAEAEARYAEVASAEAQMEAARARLTQAELRIQQRERDLAETESEVARYRQQRETLAGIIAEREAIEEGYRRLQTARETDQALGEKLQALSGLKDRLAQIDRDIQQRRAELEAQARVHRDRIAQAEKEAAELSPLQADLADLRLEIARLEAEETRRDELRNKLNALAQEDVELRATNEALYKEMQQLKARQTQLEAAEATCPLCGQPLDEQHKAAVLAEIVAEGESRRDEYLAKKARREQIEEERKAGEAELKRLEVELRGLKALRDRAARLEAAIEAAQNATDALRDERLALESVEATLTAQDFAQELLAQRREVQAQIDTLGYDSDAHTAARETLTAYSVYEQRHRELDNALRQLPEVERALAAAEERRVRWQAALADERREADAARAEIEVLKGQVEEARRREQELRECRTAEMSAQAAVVRVQQKLAALEAARQRKADLERRCEEQKLEQSLYEQLRDAFGKNGVPAMIIEAAIPELEDAANNLLTRMTGGRMHVRFDTQREKKGGGAIETLDILISDELGTRSYDLYSGGEAFRVNFAIRVALSQMLARRAGAQLRTLFIDEGFGTQDDEGRQRLVEAITAIQDQFDLVLVITHMEELREAFPVQIVVNKTPEGSRVIVR